MNINIYKKMTYLLAAAACLLWPSISSALALSLGLLVGIGFSNPFADKTRALTPKLLALAVMGLGAGMDLQVVLRIGLDGFIYTLLGISVTIALGLFIGRQGKVPRDTSLLITVGTAICGGSAIAAAASVLKPKAQDLSVALAIVFLLNSLALFLFPRIGHFFHMGQEQFGLWSALAIHDTSSVVGASMAYGTQALQIGTTVKLARSLWIIPVTFLISLKLSGKRQPEIQPLRPGKYPWFILGFLLAAAVYTWIPGLHATCQSIDAAARRLLVLTLFVIGSNLNPSILRTMGFRPLLQGLGLWLTMAAATLFSILQNWIHL